MRIPQKLILEFGGLVIAAAVVGHESVTSSLKSDDPLTSSSQINAEASLYGVGSGVAMERTGGGKNAGQCSKLSLADPVRNFDLRTR
jgi:hypothetical protein